MRASVKSSEIIDVDVDPRQLRSAIWRRLRLFGIPVAGVLLIAGAVLAIQIGDYRADRRDVLALSQDVINTLDERVRTQVDENLGVARSVVSIVASFTENVLLEPDRYDIENIALRILSARPAIFQIYFGYPNGDFIMMTRLEDGTLATQRIETVGGQRSVTLTRRNAAGKVESVEEDKDNTYDPRKRPWYRSAIASDQVTWTDPYVFFSSGKLGITVAKAARGPGGDVFAVVGVDLSIESLSHLVGDLGIGSTGLAMILDENGDLVAFPDPKRIFDKKDGKVERRRMDEIGDPVLAEVYNRLRISGDTRTKMVIDGESYVVSASSIEAIVGRKWSLVFVVPEREFTGMLARRTHMELLLVGVVIVMFVGFTALLTYLWGSSERAANLLRDRQHAAEGRGQAFEALASTAASLDTDGTGAIRALAETAARVLGARRISVWRLERQAAGIICADCFDAATGHHTASERIAAAECPAMFDALCSGADIAVEDAESDVRLAGLGEAHLNAAACGSLLSVPVLLAGAVAGFVWIEYRRATTEHLLETQAFAKALANIMALWLTTGAQRPEAAAGQMPAAADGRPPASAPSVRASGQAPPPASAAAMRSASLTAERSRRLAADLARRTKGDDEQAATLFPAATVLFLRLSDDLTLALGAGEDGSVFGRIAQSVLRAASAHDVSYVKAVNETIVAASGFDADAEAAARNVANLALDVRDMLPAILSHAGAARATFAMGIDTGPAMGSPLGPDPAPYNLWGEAVRVAEVMAETARPGTIQVTEAGFEHLHDRFILRRRGSFFLRDVGDMETYSLGAEL